MIIGTHDHALVVLSVVVAVAASYTALDLAGRANASDRSTWSPGWIGAAAFAMGGGIWSMHFIAMLAYSMPGMEAYYDPALTALSFALAVLMTGIGFAIASRSSRMAALLASGVLMGVGIAAMHYTGMAAMRMPVQLSYSLGWVIFSIIVATGASIAALWLAFKQTSPRLKSIAALPMGFAIAGMHFAGMQATSFTTSGSVDHAHSPTSVGQTNLALLVAAITLLVLFLAVIAAMFDRRFAVLAEREAAALRRSEELLRALYRQTPLPLHALDAEGRVEEVSDAWLDLLGYHREDVIGQSLVAFMTPDSAERRQTRDWPMLLATGGPMTCEYTLRARNGQLLSVVSTSRVERDSQGSVSRVIGGLVDLTARKNAEQALVQAQKMEAIGQLTGGVAHDFNNLLSVIMGSLELLRKRVPSAPYTDRLIVNGLEAARRGASLTQRMLAFARKQDLKVEPVHVASLVNGMTDLLKSSIGPQITIYKKLEDGLPPALADTNQLELALLNLVVNARDAMAGGGSLTLSVARLVVAVEREDVGKGEYISLTVTDTGSGMDEATLARARDPFFTTKGVGKGTGLGLSMVHGFAAQSGGALLLSSRPDVGTTAEILIPVAPEDMRAATALMINTMTST